MHKLVRASLLATPREEQRIGGTGIARNLVVLGWQAIPVETILVISYMIAPSDLFGFWFAKSPLLARGPPLECK